MEYQQILEKGLAGFLQETIQKKAQKEAMMECQLFSDETEKNRLSFTEFPPAPAIEFGEAKKIPLSAGVYNLIRQMLP